MKILVPLGTRPEIIKLAPVVAELLRRGHDVRTVATGQHYDPSLSDTFFDQLSLHPDSRWTLSGTDAQRLGSILTQAVDEVVVTAPDLMLLLGDTNTVPLFSLAARRYRVPVAHLEAGLRSFNETSMEEVNRKVAAACCSLHLAPTELAGRFLLAEGVAEKRIRIVGNPVIDVLRQWDIGPRPVAERSGVVFTAHRASNVDDPVRLAQLVEIVQRLAMHVGPVTFPVHPRTESRLIAIGMYDTLASTTGVSMVAPLPYDEMLRALQAASLVVTDSGGLQEEASWLGMPVVVLRRSTPRWEGVANGTSVLVGTDPDSAIAAATAMTTLVEQDRISKIPCPYGDGHSANRVADVLEEPGIAELLSISEPDFTGGMLPNLA